MTEVLKMLPEAAYFHTQSHSFSLNRSTLGPPMTFLSFSSGSKLAYKWIRLIVTKTTYEGTYEYIRVHTTTYGTYECIRVTYE